MNKLKIPVSFEALGHTVNVVYGDDVYSSHGTLGVCVFMQNKIILQSNLPGFPICKDALLHTFYHEKAHFFLFCMGSPLNDDENFVDLLGNLMMQSDKTAKFK